MDESTAVSIIEKRWIGYLKRKTCKSILKIFKKHKKGWLKLPKVLSNSEYEEACGFTEETRTGSKAFCNKLGKFMEDIYDTSVYYDKMAYSGVDGCSDKYYFEVKNRFNTMKGSMAVKEILPKLEKSIEENKGFILLILIDDPTKSDSRKIPLHKGNSMNSIKNHKGYDAEKHLWISGNEVYKFLFPHFPKTVKRQILALISSMK